MPDVEIHTTTVFLGDGRSITLPTLNVTVRRSALPPTGEPEEGP